MDKRGGRRRSLGWRPRLLLGLHRLRDQRSHRCGGLLLHPVRGMGVGAEREPCVVVTQHPTHGLDVHAVLERQGSERVSKVVEADFDKILFLATDFDKRICRIEELNGGI